MRAVYWFGGGLAFGALFLWCLVSVIEAGAATAGWIWGLVVFGLLGLGGLCMAAWLYWGTSQGAGTDPLLRAGTRAALRPGSGRDLAGTGEVPRGAGGVPRAAAGRSLY